MSNCKGKPPHSKSATRRPKVNSNFVQKSGAVLGAVHKLFVPFVLFLVEAPHLDLSSNRAFLSTMAKHPSNWSKNGDVGHAWIYLQGEGVYLEGGHSGELGEKEPTYFDGIIHNVAKGDPNPVKYLWNSLPDGFFQWGSGGHRPTYAVAIPLNPAQFDQIVAFLQTYDYSRYSLTDHQCCTLIVQIAQLLNLQLDCKEVLKIESILHLMREEIPLWCNSQYSCLTFESPDKLEKELQRLVREKRATCALKWYQNHHPKQCSKELFSQFPRRYARWLYFR